MNQKGFPKIALVILIIILAGATGYFVFVKKSQQLRQTSNLHIFQTNDEFRLSLRYPEHWSILRRGNQIVLWSTVEALDGRSEVPQLEKLESANVVSDTTRPRDFAIVTIFLVSGVQESLTEYANYATEYARQHPLFYDGMSPLLLQSSDVAKLRLQHVVQGEELFVQIAPSQVATIKIRTDAQSTQSSLETLKKQALDIIVSLERLQ